MTPSRALEARHRYSAALRCDPSNTRALLNLAIIDSRTAYGDSTADAEWDRVLLVQARLTLTRLRAATLVKEARRSADRYPKDPIWYWATYHLAADLLHDHLAHGSDEPLATVTDLTAELVAAIELAIRTRARRDLMALLVDFRGPSLVLHAGATLEAVRQEANAPDRRARSAARAEGLDLGPAMRIIERLQRPPDARTHYNLACFEASRAELLGPTRSGPKEVIDGAFAHLAIALAGASEDLIAWAADDPSLKPLRQRSVRPRFADLLDWARRRVVNPQLPTRPATTADRNAEDESNE